MVFFLSQKKYITDILTKYNMLHVKPLQLPMDTDLKLTLTKVTFSLILLSIKDSLGG